MLTATRMKVRDVMSPKLIALNPTDTINTAAKLMREHDIGAVVVNAGAEFHGIVTDRDIVVRAIADSQDPRNVTVGEICSRDLISLKPDDDLVHALETMRDRAVRRLLVMDGDTAIGIISIGDLAQTLDRTSVLGEISSAPPNH